MGIYGFDLDESCKNTQWDRLDRVGAFGNGHAVCQFGGCGQNPNRGRSATPNFDALGSSEEKNCVKFFIFKYFTYIFLWPPF